MMISVTACDHRVEATATPPSTTLSASAKAKVAAVARRLVEQDRAAEAVHRAEMDRLIDASVLQIHDGDRQTSLLVHVENKGRKTIRAFDAGLSVHLTSNGKRVGLTELHLNRDIPPNGDATFLVSLSFVRFGEDTASMRLAEGKAKRARLEVTEIKYADGSDAGYDD
jgi:hypothetical protein